MLAIVIIQGVALALLAVLVVGLLRNQAELMLRLHQLDGGPDADAQTVPRVTSDRRAFDLVGTTPKGGVARIAVTDRAQSTLIAFLSSGCTTCRDFWTAFAADGFALPGEARLVVVTKGPENESPTAVAALAPPGVQVVMSTEAWNQYEVPTSPYFLLVDGSANRVVGEGAARSWSQLASLLGRADADAEDALLAAGITPGDPRLYHRDAP